MQNVYTSDIQIYLEYFDDQELPSRPSIRFVEDFGDDGLVAAESKPIFTIPEVYKSIYIDNESFYKYDFML